MRGKIKNLQIGERQFTIKEIRPVDYREFLLDAGALNDSPSSNDLIAMLDRHIPRVIDGCKFEHLEMLYTSELMILWGAVKEVNADFFVLAPKVMGAAWDQIFKAWSTLFSALLLQGTARPGTTPGPLS